MDFDEMCRRYRLSIVERALARRSELGEVVASTILAELPEYANGRSEHDLEDIRAGVQQTVDFFLATMHRGCGIEPAERDVLRRTGAQRARQGIPVAALLASVKIGVRVGRRFLMGCTDVGDDATALMGAFEQVNEALDRFEDVACASLAEGHAEAWCLMSATTDRGEALFVDRLLERRFEDEDEILSHASALGLSGQRAARVVVVAAVASDDLSRLQSTAADIRSNALGAVGPTRLGRTPHVPLVVQPRDLSHWRSIVAHLGKAATRHGTAVVWSEAAERLTGLSPLYHGVCEDLAFLPAATTRPGAVSSLLPRFHRAMSTGTSTERAEVVAHVLQPLMSLATREREELMQTLDGLYETGASLSGLARHLHLHKNTVGNRLRRVQEVVGLDVRRPAERLVLEAVLRMRHLGAAGGDEAAPEWSTAR